MGKLLDTLPSIAAGILAALVILTFVNTLPENIVRLNLGGWP